MCASPLRHASFGLENFGGACSIPRRNMYGETCMMNTIACMRFRGPGLGVRYGHPAAADAEFLTFEGENGTL